MTAAAAAPSGGGSFSSPSSWVFFDCCYLGASERAFPCMRAQSIVRRAEGEARKKRGAVGFVVWLWCIFFFTRLRIVLYVTIVTEGWGWGWGGVTRCRVVATVGKSVGLRRIYVDDGRCSLAE